MQLLVAIFKFKVLSKSRRKKIGSMVELTFRHNPRSNFFFPLPFFFPVDWILFWGRDGLSRPDTRPGQGCAVAKHQPGETHTAINHQNRASSSSSLSTAGQLTSRVLIPDRLQGVHRYTQSWSLVTKTQTQTVRLASGNTNTIYSRLYVVCAHTNPRPLVHNTDMIWHTLIFLKFDRWMNSKYIYVWTQSALR